MSEKALGLLQKSEFHKGLVAGVPSGTIVAHKFGERDGLTIGEKQLHDCGIIYYPGNPYLLCVMTRGDNFDELAGVVFDVDGDVNPATFERLGEQIRPDLELLGRSQIDDAAQPQRLQGQLVCGAKLGQAPGPIDEARAHPTPIAGAIAADVAEVDRAGQCQEPCAPVVGALGRHDQGRRVDGHSPGPTQHPESGAGSGQRAKDKT